MIFRLQNGVINNCVNPGADRDTRSAPSTGEYIDSVNGQPTSYSGNENSHEKIKGEFLGFSTITLYYGSLIEPGDSVSYFGNFTLKEVHPSV